MKAVSAVRVILLFSFFVCVGLPLAVLGLTSEVDKRVYNRNVRTVKRITK